MSQTEEIAPATSEPVLSPAGRSWRLIVTAVVIALSLATTAWGTDADFPFAPMRMFANADPVNKPVKSTYLEAITVNGDRIVVRGSDIGMRRAEFEGQMRRFRKDRDLMAAMSRAYEKRNPDKPHLVQIDVMVREYELRDGRPTKEFKDVVVLSWYREKDK